MIKDVKYILTEEEYEELKHKLVLLESTIRAERDRLKNIEDKTESETISHNAADYNMSLIYDVRRLAL